MVSTAYRTTKTSESNAMWSSPARPRDFDRIQSRPPTITMERTVSTMQTATMTGYCDRLLTSSVAFTTQTMVAVVPRGEEWLGSWCCDLLRRAGRRTEDVGVKHPSWHGAPGKQNPSDQVSVVVGLGEYIRFLGVLDGWEASEGRADQRSDVRQDSAQQR